MEISRNFNCHSKKKCTLAFILGEAHVAVVGVAVFLFGDVYNNFNLLLMLALFLDSFVCTSQANVHGTFVWHLKIGYESYSLWQKQ